MKCSILYINRDRDFYAPPTALKGWTGRQYGTASWSPETNKQVCRIPNAQWSMAMEEDILKLSHLPGNQWLRAVEFECADGKRFTDYEKALAHEAGAPPVAEPISTVIPSGIPVTIEAVEKAGSAILRELAKAAAMPDYRKLTQADQLRPALIAFLRSQEAPPVVEESKAEAS